MLSKVPEITVWFWIIKILCTTVGESFADWVDMTLGVGLTATAVIFTAVLVAALAWQLALDRYQPVVYWLTVVVVSVTGTLYTDILTDSLGVPLALSTAVFAATLAVVFGVWYLRERTLSIHSIVTLARESFYWLAILVTFALGTAIGDWTLELTGWGPGVSVLLPAGLIVAIVIGWKLGANPVLSFWLAYILTRPLGANLGDWLGFPTNEQGLGLGVAVTSAVFLAAILVTVAYLTITRADVIDKPAAARVADPGREKLMLGYFGVVAAATAAVLSWAHAQPHQDSRGAEGPAAVTAIAPGQATATFPAADIATFRALSQSMRDKVEANDQAGAASDAQQLETAWDDDQPRLQAVDAATWSAIDGRIDAVLTAVRATHPDPTTETRALDDLLAALA